MESSNNNLLLRFTTFWWGLWTFFIFAVILGGIMLFNSSGPISLEDAPAKVRYETKTKTDAAQAASVSLGAIHSVTAEVAKSLLSSKPVAVETPTQLVPGSATSKKLAAAPAVDTKAMDAAPTDVDAPIDPAVLAIGKAQYMLCGACHGMNGEGGMIAPPLAASEWVLGPISNLIKIQLRGLNGPITVAGKDYNFPGGMAALSYQTDDQIAAVLTYVRNNFGNKASAVKPEQVASLRGEVGKPQVTAGDLIKP